MNGPSIANLGKQSVTEIRITSRIKADTVSVYIY